MKAVFTLLFLALVLVLVGCERAPADPSDVEIDPDRAAFVTLLGEDTLAVERFHRTPTGIESSVVLRSPRTLQSDSRLTLDEAGRLVRFEMTARPPDAVEWTQRMEAEPVGDSLRVTVVQRGEAAVVRTLAAGAFALPFIDMVHWPFEMVLTRAHAADADSLTQQLFTPRGTLAFAVEKTGEGRMRLTHPFRGPMEVEVDEAGRLVRLDAGQTTRKLIVTRVHEVELEALGADFAARDTSGRGFGPLSGRGETTAAIGAATVMVDYGTPSKRGRDLFGALVPYGTVWRTGANRATHLTTDRALQFGDLAVPAGTYTLYSIPEADGATLLINRQTGQGGTTYDEAQDLGRVPMTRTTLDASVEVFTVAVEADGGGGVLRLQWGTTSYDAPFTVR